MSNSQIVAAVPKYSVQQVDDAKAIGDEAQQATATWSCRQFMRDQQINCENAAFSYLEGITRSGANLVASIEADKKATGIMQNIKSKAAIGADAGSLFTYSILFPLTATSVLYLMTARVIYSTIADYIVPGTQSTYNVIAPAANSVYNRVIVPAANSAYNSISNIGRKIYSMFGTEETIEEVPATGLVAKIQSEQIVTEESIAQTEKVLTPVKSSWFGSVTNFVSTAFNKVKNQVKMKNTTSAVVESTVPAIVEIKEEKADIAVQPKAINKITKPAVVSKQKPKISKVKNPFNKLSSKMHLANEKFARNNFNYGNRK